MTDERQRAFDALVDDTDIAMSIDGENASYHTKRLASVLHSVKAELARLREAMDLIEKKAWGKDTSISGFRREVVNIIRDFPGSRRAGKVATT